MSNRKRRLSPMQIDDTSPSLEQLVPKTRRGANARTRISIENSPVKKLHIPEYLKDVIFQAHKMTSEKYVYQFTLTINVGESMDDDVNVYIHEDLLVGRWRIICEKLRLYGFLSHEKKLQYAVEFFNFKENIENILDYIHEFYHVIYKSTFNDLYTLRDRGEVTTSPQEEESKFNSLSKQVKNDKAKKNESNINNLLKMFSKKMTITKRSPKTKASLFPTYENNLVLAQRLYPNLVHSFTNDEVDFLIDCYITNKIAILLNRYHSGEKVSQSKITTELIDDNISDVVIATFKQRTGSWYSWFNGLNIQRPSSKMHLDKYSSQETDEEMVDTSKRHRKQPERFTIEKQKKQTAKKKPAYDNYSLLINYMGISTELIEMVKRSKLNVVKMSPSLALTFTGLDLLVDIFIKNVILQGKRDILGKEYPSILTKYDERYNDKQRKKKVYAKRN